MWELYQRKVLPDVEPRIKEYLWTKDGVVIHQRIVAPIGWLKFGFIDYTQREVRDLKEFGFKKVRKHRMNQDQLEKGWLVL